MTTVEPLSYIARAECGCIRAAIVDVPRLRREIAREMPRWIRDGYTIERVTCETVRQELRACPHREEPAAAKQGVLL